MEVFAERDYPIDHFERDSGLITTHMIEFEYSLENYCDCGSIGMTPFDKYYVRFNLILKRTSNDSCELKIFCKFQYGDTSCVSTGGFELQLCREIQSKLKRG